MIFIPRLLEAQVEAKTKVEERTRTKVEEIPRRRLETDLRFSL
jgi:hypothetical protein